MRIYIIFFLLLNFVVNAQSANAPCNDYSPLVIPTYPATNLSVVSSGLSGDHWSDKGNLIDSNLENFTSWSPFLVGTAWIEARNTSTDFFPLGSYAGFVIEDVNLLSLGASMTITTYNGTTVQDTKQFTNLLGLTLGGNKRKIGFVTTKPFNRVRLTVNAGVSLVFTARVYYAEVLKPCPPTVLPTCNVATPLTRPTRGVIIENERTGLTGVTLGTITNATNIVNDDPDDYATISLPVGILASASLSIRDISQVYPAGYFAGFEISNTSLLGLSLLGNSQIRTYLNGVEQESHSGNSLLLGVPLLNSSGRQTVGFVANLPFDEVRYTVNQPVGLNLGVTNVYSAVVKRYCAGPELECNTNSYISSPIHPVEINPIRTGVNAEGCVACNVSNVQNVIDGDTNSYSTIEIALGVGAEGAISVKNNIDKYPIGTFAGFDISNPNILNANFLSGITLELYNEGNLVQTGNGNTQLISANVGLLNGNNRSTVGVISNFEFDEVRIRVFNLVALSLGEIRVYGLMLEKGCSPTALPECNVPARLTRPDRAIVIDGSVRLQTNLDILE